MSIKVIMAVIAIIGMIGMTSASMPSYIGKAATEAINTNLAGGETTARAFYNETKQAIVVTVFVPLDVTTIKGDAGFQYAMAQTIHNMRTIIASIVVKAGSDASYSGDAKVEVQVVGNTDAYLVYKVGNILMDDPSVENPQVLYD